MVIALTANGFVRKGEAVVDALHEGNGLRQADKTSLSQPRVAGGRTVCVGQLQYSTARTSRSKLCISNPEHSQQKKNKASSVIPV